MNYDFEQAYYCWASYTLTSQLQHKCPKRNQGASQITFTIKKLSTNREIKPTKLQMLFDSNLLLMLHEHIPIFMAHV